MNVPDTNKFSATNWARVDALTDDEIDTSDIPPLTEEELAGATLRMPRQPVAVTLHVDSDVLEWFKAQGAEYEWRINAALRIYVEAHKTYSR